MIFPSRMLSSRNQWPGTHRNAFSWVTDRGGPPTLLLPHMNMRIALLKRH